MKNKKLKATRKSTTTKNDDDNEIYWKFKIKWELVLEMVTIKYYKREWKEIQMKSEFYSSQIIFSFLFFNSTILILSFIIVVVVILYCGISKTQWVIQKFQG